MKPGAAVLAGIAYGAAGFGAGFLLGAVRVMLVAPRIGVLAAVALEIPLMLGIGVLMARRLTSGDLTARASMGAIGLAVLMALEVALSAAMGTGVRPWLQGLLTPAGALGLAGQVAFALLPLVTRPLRA